VRIYFFCAGIKKQDCGRHDHESQHATLRKDSVGEEQIKDEMLLRLVKIRTSAQQYLGISSND
jgi:hypothetical protein